jgi:hypothetical protein
MRKPTASDPDHWARKLHEAAAELRASAGRAPDQGGLKLARRLERYAEAILFPHRHRHDPLSAAGGDD